jgi:hypothetical protein
VKPEPAGFLKHLDCCDIGLNPNHLAQQTQLADLNQLVERRVA